MTLAHAVGSPRTFMRRRWKMVAFLARYGHQQVQAMRGMTIRDLSSLADEIGEIMREENEFSRAHESGATGGG